MRVSSNQPMRGSPDRVVDFDLHGVVRIRLVNPGTRDYQDMVRRLGAPLAVAEGVPDITIRFEENLSSGSMKYVGLNFAGYTDDSFYLLDRQTGGVAARIPFELIGGPYEMVSRKGAGSVPLFSDLIRSAFLAKDYVPLHASAFVYEGVTVLVTGWAKGGKTESLLGFVNHGAQHVGDEWVVLSPGGEKVLGLPVRITVWEWQFKYVKNLLPKLGFSRTLMFKAVHLLDALHRVSLKASRGTSESHDAFGEIVSFLKRGLKIRELPEKLFGNKVRREPSNLDRLVLTVSHSEDEIRVEPCDPVQVALKAAASNEYEHGGFLDYYRAFKFAFPHRHNNFLETMSAIETSLLLRAVEGKIAYRILHPYPVSLDAMFEALKPICKPVRQRALVSEHT